MCNKDRVNKWFIDDYINLSTLFRLEIEKLNYYIFFKKMNFNLVDLN